METLYDVLGVDPDAGPGEIRTAYRERVKRHHPDVDGGDAAAFRRLTTARDVLLDGESRARYDALGHRRYARHHLGEEWPVEEPPRAAGKSRSQRSRPQPRRRRSRRVVRDRGRHRRRASGPADAAVALGTYRSVLVRAGVVLLALFALAVVLSALSL
ncbi:chaperone protein DnaJ [Halalkalicoccus paucihalophilus]|uniref:Chaperone protein DnaJ n=1 Tax=Halalkalicoccus paucihalophilus TaxID=1008153 RepID=A0A151AI75_9EURY|nr:J domain-containing protein [Halalkalicoccus paucihalophilus]KYH27210.1 chaperone protein DnaJ [Halalkalicoccus paucihalophilus]